MFARLFASSKSDAPPAEVPPAAAPVRRAAAGPADAARSSQDQALIDALVESRKRFKQIVEISGDFAWETDRNGNFVFVSPGVTLGYRPDEMTDGPVSRYLAETGLSSRETPFFAREPVRDVDIWLRTADGGKACVRTSAVPITDANGDWSGARGVCRDVTEDRRRDGAIAALQMREALMARILRTAVNEIDPDTMLQTALAETLRTFSADYIDLRRPDADGGFDVWLSAEAPEVEEDDETAEAEAETEDAVAPAGDAPVLKSVIARMADGRTLVTAADGDRHYLCAPTVFRGEVTGAFLVVRELGAGAWSEDERTFADELAAQFAILLAQADGHRKLEAMAREDELTGLLNRRAFFSDLADRVARIRNGGSAGSLFYVDLDNFKAVNDVHGHKRGDEALKALADMLVTRTRPGDLVARLGGDEFAMWLERTDEEAAHGRAQELLEASMGLRIYSGSPDMPLGMSVGVAVYHARGGETIEDLTARADAAMYEIKHGTKSGYVISTAAPGAAAETKHVPAPREASA